MSKTVSPTQASKQTGVSRWTVLRAVKSGELKAHRDNRNYWQINQKSLDEWSTARGVLTVPAQGDAQVNIADKVHLAHLETENRFLKDQVTDLKQDRDAWRKQAERVSEPIKRSWFWRK